MSTRLRRAVATIICSGLLLSAGVNAAQAATPPNTLTPAEEQNVKGWLVENGVTGQTADTLVRKWDQGIIWDSVKGAKPTSKTETSDDFTTTTRSVFADGSVTVSTAEKPQVADPNARSVTGCSFSGTSSSSKAAYCLVEDSYGTVTANFRADYVINRGGYDQITKVQQGGISVSGGTWKSETLRITQGTETSSLVARATHQFVIVLAGGVGQTTSRHYLIVGKDYARSVGDEL